MGTYLCGVDLGGTKLSVGLLLTDGTLIDKRRVHDHINMDKDQVVATIVNLIKDLMQAHDLKDCDLIGIGIGVTGHINSKQGVIITSSNFRTSFNNFPLRDSIAKHFKTRVIVDNDANAQAYGEHCFGAGKSYSDMIFITISTGIGSGLIIGNNLIRGITGTAGEIGHTIIDLHSDIRCSCGNYGCLMALSSGLYLPQLYRKHLEQGMKSSIGIEISKVSQVDGILLKKGIDTGDAISLAVLKDSAYAIGTGLYNLFQILNPQVFIIGGGLTNIGDIYLDQIKERFFSLGKDMMYDKIDFIYSTLGNDAGLIGAAALILEEK